jgi:hypothetical protein
LETPDDKNLKEKLYGVNNREKFRIRYYNDDPSFIKLEKKTKVNGLGTKLSAPLTKAECEKLLAVCGSVFIGIILMLFANKKQTDNPYILVVDCDNSEAEKEVLATVSQSVKKYLVKSKTVSAKGIELTVEVRLKEMSTDFINQLAAASGVHNAVLVSYNGDYQT